MQAETIILGAGMTGLAAGLASGFPIFEKKSEAGGICSSYYINPSTGETVRDDNKKEDSYRFERGGGHWIHVRDSSMVALISGLVPVRSYSRKAAVYFVQKGQYVPYPLQDNLAYIDKEMAIQAVEEMANSGNKTCSTMKKSIQQVFTRISRHRIATNP